MSFVAADDHNGFDAICFDCVFDVGDYFSSASWMIDDSEFVRLAVGIETNFSVQILASAFAVVHSKLLISPSLTPIKHIMRRLATSKR